MRLVVISSAPIVRKEDQDYLYTPYEKEMRLWSKYSGNILFCCPIWNEDRNLLIAPVSFEFESVIKLNEFDITSLLNILNAIPKVFINLFKIYKAMQQADHIHLRCPGNMGLLGAIAQISFPNTSKTAKYAGNWDPKAKQPWSYRLQKWILSNTFLTRNIQVLVYGEWEACSRNIKPFFTATYSEKDKTDIDYLQENRLSLLRQSEIRLLFVGALSKGKQPLYAIQLAEQLQLMNYSVRLDLYGDGEERNHLETYIFEKDLQNSIVLHGNHTMETIQLAYQSSHFLILPSQSEGWPKVVAEAMFWSCVPLATAVSCVPTMLAHGDRGLLLSMDMENDSTRIQNTVADASIYLSKATKAAQWSRQYTLDCFETEIEKLLKGIVQPISKAS